MAINTEEVQNPELRQFALVTGATGAIGKAIAERITFRSDHEVVFLFRNEERAEATAKHIQQRTENNRVRYEPADIARQASSASLAKRWSGPLHILVNDAVITPRRREVTCRFGRDRNAVDALHQACEGYGDSQCRLDVNW